MSSPLQLPLPGQATAQLFPNCSLATSARLMGIPPLVTRYDSPPWLDYWLIFANLGIDWPSPHFSLRVQTNGYSYCTRKRTSYP
jgi:hypothetical protein